jgi:hypothetical protein
MGHRSQPVTVTFIHSFVVSSLYYLTEECLPHPACCYQYWLQLDSCNTCEPRYAPLLLANIITVSIVIQASCLCSTPAMYQRVNYYCTTVLCSILHYGNTLTYSNTLMHESRTAMSLLTASTVLIASVGALQQGYYQHHYCQ